MKLLSAKLPEILVITHFPSPYQVELFDAITRAGQVSLKIIYLHQQDAGRKWANRDLVHWHVFSSDLKARTLILKNLVKQSDLLIISFYQSRLSAEAVSLCRKLKKPVVFWSERPHEHRFSWFSRMLRLIILRGRPADMLSIWGIGSLAVRKYKSDFGLAREYVNFPYYSDLSRFSRSVRDERKNCVQERGPITFLYSGGLNQRKGVDVLAEAFLNLISDGWKVRLVFLGAGELRSELESNLRNCMGSVEFLGFRDWENLPAVYSRADVLCVPSRHDGWALVVPEGLAAGLPVIATTSTGAAVDLIKPGNNGWLVPCGDVTALASAMREAASLDSDTLRKMSANAQASVANHQLEDGARLFAAETIAALRRYRRNEHE